ncbi:hypothetical protein [Novosphingobium sp. PC22D]|uniref:hypothetical protein n=1 Tax=Novosphingobium sp. PC22D TaxID=1962403 RepID=UPI00197D1D5C|nr:hypothetical protein [Novosphingobium sp. PC22D]
MPVAQIQTVGERHQTAWRWRPEKSLLTGDASLVATWTALVLLIYLRPVSDSDIFWQLRLGELIVSRGGLVDREPFSQLHLGEPLSHVAWGGQVIMASVRGLFGWSGLKLFDALCWTGGFAAVGLACRRLGAPAPSIAFAWLAGMVAALPMAMLRPQSLAALCFGLLLALRMLPLRTGPKITLGCLLLAIWQNLHPSVAVAAIAMGAAAATGWLVFWRDRTRAAPLAETAFALFAAASVLLTPDGLAIFATSAKNAELAVMVGVSEWLPAIAPLNRLVAVPVLLITALAARLLWPRRRALDLTSLAIAAALLLMTVAAYRFVLFYAIALVPPLAATRLFAEQPAAGPEAATQPRDKRAVALAGIACAIVAALAVALFPPSFSNHIPFKAMEKLRETGASGTIFADSAQGGALIDTGYPEWRVAMDGRFYRYSRAEWKDMMAIRAGRLGLAYVEQRYRPSALVLWRARQAPLIAEISRKPGHWRQIWSDAGFVVFAREQDREQQGDHRKHDRVAQDADVAQVHVAARDAGKARKRQQPARDHP